MALTDVAVAVWILAFAAGGGLAVRLTVVALAAYAAHRALRTAPRTEAGDRIRRHRLAVLRVLLNFLLGHRT